MLKRLALQFLSLIVLLTYSAIICTAQSTASDNKDDGKLRIVCFGAHPDDAEYKSGGTAAMWAKLGHHVLLVSVTNGDIGHWKMAGGELAKRRTAESAEVAKRLGATSKVLDIHDGELLPTLENRKTICKIIREWNADIVISHRPWDYHPDHRYTGHPCTRRSVHGDGTIFLPRRSTLKEKPSVFVFQRSIYKTLSLYCRRRCRA